jgi:NCS1 family nucleobase:cation symporter-1
MYKLEFLLSFCMGGLVYHVLCLMWPVQVLPNGIEQSLAFEELATNKGFFEHESVSTATGVLDREAVVAEHYLAEGKESKV